MIKLDNRLQIENSFIETLEGTKTMLELTLENPNNVLLPIISNLLSHIREVKDINKKLEEKLSNLEDKIEELEY